MTRTYTYANITGLRRALRSLSKEASATLRDASMDIAESVAFKATAKARSIGGVAKHVTVKAVRDRVPKVVMGGAGRLPSGGVVGDVIWGSEFGSDRYRQFSPWRGNSTGAGYFLWPTVRGEHDAIIERYGDALMDAVDKAAR